MIHQLLPFRHLLLPAALLTGFGALAPYLSTLPPHWVDLIPVLPWLLAPLLLLLSWHFNSSRALLANALLALLYMAPTANIPEPASLTLFAANMGLVGLYREQGLLNHRSMARYGVIAVQLSLLAWASRYHPHWLDLFDYPIPWLAGQPPPLPTVVSLTLVALLLLWRTIRVNHRIDAGLLLTLVAGYWISTAPLSAEGQQLLFAVALLIGCIALLGYGHGLAYLDELTGLPGRRALNEAMMGLGRRYAVAMVDVDHFKKFNDRHGHDVGDQVLKLVAAKLAAVNGGRAFRYGGEEFCVLFRRRDAKAALEPLEQLRQAIEQARLQLRGPHRPGNRRQGKALRGTKPSAGRSVAVTVSIGVSDSQHSDTPLKQADKALYRAKKQGRNRVCL